MSYSTSAELRARAREFLRGGVYSTYFLALVLLSLVALPLQVVMSPSIMKPGLFHLDGCDPFVLGGILVAGSILVVYLWGFILWSQSAIMLACVRKGLTFEHAFSGWGHGWKMAWLMGIQSTYIFLWSLLFIVPGIMATFSYALAPLIQVDHPEWGACACIRESSRLMKGNRLRLMYLLLSFWIWYLFSLVIFCLIPFIGSLAFEFLRPYTESAIGAFYEELLDNEDN